jgi:hypothetical protein
VRHGRHWPREEQNANASRGSATPSGDEALPPVSAIGGVGGGGWADEMWR